MLPSTTRRDDRSQSDCAAARRLHHGARTDIEFGSWPFDLTSSFILSWNIAHQGFCHQPPAPVARVLLAAAGALSMCSSYIWS